MGSPIAVCCWGITGSIFAWCIVTSDRRSRETTPHLPHSVAIASLSVRHYCFLPAFTCVPGFTCSDRAGQISWESVVRFRAIAFQLIESTRITTRYTHLIGGVPFELTTICFTAGGSFVVPFTLSHKRNRLQYTSRVVNGLICFLLVAHYTSKPPPTRCVETLGGYFELNIFTNTLEHALQLHVLSRAGTNSMTNGRSGNVELFTAFFS